MYRIYSNSFDIDALIFFHCYRQIRVMLRFPHKFQVCSRGFFPWWLTIYRTVLLCVAQANGKSEAVLAKTIAQRFIEHFYVCISRAYKQCTKEEQKSIQQQKVWTMIGQSYSLAHVTMYRYIFGANTKTKWYNWMEKGANVACFV